MENDPKKVDVNKVNDLRVADVLSAIKAQSDYVELMKSSIESRGKRLGASSDYQYELARLTGMVFVANHLGLM